ncbi:hypothetical protein HRbin36_01855 [bacterium HR36]|nr:hypothetical protein HRbin36_01855 [bacterium HR36]
MDLLRVPRVPVDMLGNQAARLAQMVKSKDLRSVAGTPQSKESLQEAARCFEALFYSLLIKELRQSTQELGEGLFAGDQADIFGSLFDYYLGQFLAQRQQLGIGRLLEEQYRRSDFAAAGDQQPGGEKTRPSEGLRVG